MKAKAELRFQYSDTAKAEKVAYLLEVDNRIAPRSLRIKTRTVGGAVVTELEHRKLNTLLAALDDLLFTERLIVELLPIARSGDA
jgi:hypothetical protein